MKLVNLHKKCISITATLGLLFLLISCEEKPVRVSHSSSLSQSEQVIPDIVDFNFHIKPILSDRCFTCHGPDKAKIEAGLSLTSFEAATIALGDKQDHYAIVPNKPAESTLIDRIHSTDPIKQMPPPESNLTLNDYEKKLLTKWIEQGAKWKQHWSFLPINEDKLASKKDGKYINNLIDQYIAEKQKESPLRFSKRADKERLIRRMSFDITGLAPTNAEIDAFINDQSDDAINKIIDRYLASDAYAENMTVQWLDLARYADTHGYQDDLERVMWPWRDWVIHAYKTNMPFDQFVTWQLAGDLLPNANKEQILATGFNRNHSITQEGGVIPEEYRVEYVADRTQTFGKAFLGLTVECARCHDHKYDPISAENYYSLFSFFNNVPEKGLIEAYGAIPEPYMTISDEELESTLSFINNVDTMQDIPVMVMKEMPKPRQAYILERGGYENHGAEVFPSTPESILAFDDYNPNRLGLANWLFDKKNPLTARVAVNRIWMMLFGQGIVKTSDDFGAQGALPTHPELLDHLALEFMNSDWDVKYMIKYIMQSHTYQQSSIVDDEVLELDPENTLYSHAPRLRLSAEKIRDHILSSSGLLVAEVGGPSVKPYQPPGLWDEKRGGGGGSTAEYQVDKNGKQFRRSLYTFWKRTVPPPGMMTFDAVSRDLCMVQRESTSTPLQALIMMNNPEVLEASKNLAINSMIEYSKPEERIHAMFTAATSRRASETEIQSLLSYLENEQVKFSEKREDAIELLQVKELDNNLNIIETAAFTMIAYTIYNLDETISRS